MKNKELLYLCTEQIKHLADTIKKMDSAGVFEHPMISTTNTLHLIKMAMDENREQELVTRLYNLVSALELLLPSVDPADVHSTGVAFQVNEARETLKKVIQ